MKNKMIDWILVGSIYASLVWLTGSAVVGCILAFVLVAYANAASQSK